MNLYRVFIREPGAVTELETVRSDNMHDAIEKVRQQLIKEKRTLTRVTFSAVRIGE